MSIEDKNKSNDGFPSTPGISKNRSEEHVDTMLKKNDQLAQSYDSPSATESNVSLVSNVCTF